MKNMKGQDPQVNFYLVKVAKCLSKARRHMAEAIGFAGVDIDDLDHDMVDLLLAIELTETMTSDVITDHLFLSRDDDRWDDDRVCDPQEHETREDFLSCEVCQKDEEV